MATAFRCRANHRKRALRDVHAESDVSDAKHGGAATGVRSPNATLSVIPNRATARASQRASLRATIMRRVVGATLVMIACSSREASKPDDASTSATDASGPITWWFDDVAKASGIDYRIEVQPTLSSRMQGAVCILDVDGDGKPDILLPSYEQNGGSTTRLYMNRGPMKFAEEAAARGISDTDHAGGCVTFDSDGDGDIDALTVGHGNIHFFRNDGGTFTRDDSVLPPYKPSHYYTAALAFDADRDGDLDLVVTSYGEQLDLASCRPNCLLTPDSFYRGFTLLWLRRDDGTYDDLSSRVVVDENGEPNLVALATDLDDDGRADIFVGNDLNRFQDRYWRDVGTAEYLEQAKKLGVATAKSLKGICSMSANDGDVDGDGNLDLVQSSYDSDTSVIFLCKDGTCNDRSDEYELFREMSNLRWGQALVDLDDDGLPELFESVGHFYTKADLAWAKGLKIQDSEAPPRLWHHTEGLAPFRLVAAEQGLAAKTGGRGVAVGDLDGDGAMDIVVGPSIGSPLVLKNVRANRGHYLNVKLKGRGKNTAGIGSLLRATVGSRTSAAMLHAGSSYHSTNQPIIHFGVGAATRVDRLVVRWPVGGTTELRDISADQTLVVEEK